MNEPAAIDVSGVCKSYEEGRIRALDRMDLRVPAASTSRSSGRRAVASRRCCT